MQRPRKNKRSGAERLFFAGFFLALSTQAISHQDAMVRFQAGIGAEDRWRAHLVTRSAPGQFASPIASGAVSLFVNRADKTDSLRAPRQFAFTAGVFGAVQFFDPVVGAPKAEGMAFVMPPKPAASAVAEAKPDATGTPIDKPETKAIAYAPSDDSDGAPFEAVIGTGGKAKIVLQADAPATHAWVNHSIPDNARTKKEKRCLANAIYFEARGEKELGRLAVAQVVLNRLKNPAYPNTICSVVYQNKQKRNRCQFSFACDGIRDRITDKKSWAEAQDLTERILADDRTLFLDKVGASTHYHATYVRPGWSRRMKRKQKIGRHIFYQTYKGGWS